MREDQPAPVPRADNRLWQNAADGLLRSVDVTQSGRYLPALACDDTPLLPSPPKHPPDAAADGTTTVADNAELAAEEPTAEPTAEPAAVQLLLDYIGELERRLESQRQHVTRMERVLRAFFDRI